VEVTVEHRNLFPDVRFVDSTRLSRMKEGAERRCAFLAENGVDALNMHHTDWNGGLVTLAHKFELFAFGWDMQFDHVMTNLMRMGIDAVYSDYVDRLVDVYSAEVGHVPTNSQPG
jgi:glycerophosphoryl diester phosphodiesterase